MRRILALALAVTALTLTVPAQAATLYGPGPVLNGDIAHDRQAYRYADTLMHAINGTRKGDTITVAVYRIDLEDVAGTLIKAHQRGVNVRIAEDGGDPPGGESYVQTQRLRKVLGANRAARSFLFSPRTSGFSLLKGSIHSKFWLFSRTTIGGHVYRNRVIAGSGNPTFTNTWASWNEAQVWDNAKLYAALLDYQRRIVADRNDPHWSRIVTVGSVALVMGPEAPDVILRDLKGIHTADCRRGVKIRASVFLFTHARLTTARRLRALGKAGCRVQIDLNTTSSRTLVNADVYRLLFHAPGVTVRNSHVLDHSYTHLKTLMVTDPRGSRIWTGSDNWTGGKSSELVIRSTGRAALDAYTVYLAKVWAASRPAYANDLTKNLKPATNSARHAEDELPDE